MAKIARRLVPAIGALAFILGCQLPSDRPSGPPAEASPPAARAVAYADRRDPAQVPPGGLQPNQVPQLIILGFDDNDFADGMMNAMDVVKGKANPAGTGNPLTFDGAPITLSFYVKPGGMDETTGETWEVGQDTVDSWSLAYRRGHEIGNHTYYHRHGLGFTVDQWDQEMKSCTDFIVRRCGIPREEIVGFRTPFLEYNANMPAAMKRNGFVYDVSFEGGLRYWPAEDGSTMFWPYTMDTGRPPNEDGRDFGKHAGIWEIPDDNIYYPDGSRITGLDYNMWFSKQNTKDQFVAALKYSLNKKYNGNRAPMNFGLHTNYYSAAGEADGLLYDKASWEKLRAPLQDRIAALHEFLAYAQTLPDVRIVSAKQALEWLRNPVALGTPGPATHTVTSSAGPNGEIAPAGAVRVVDGKDQAFSVLPAPGYLIENVKVDGVDMGAIKSYTFRNVVGPHRIEATFRAPHPEVARKSTIISMTNAAENSQLACAWAYAENINDGRGITFGTVGFCSGTYDGTILIRRVRELDPSHPLAAYLPAFEAIDRLPHPDGKTGVTTGLENFIRDFQAHGADEVVRRAQLEKLDELYYTPAETKFAEIGASYPITLGFLYDTCTNHGAEGEGNDKGLQILVDETIAAMGGTPKTGVNETAWLTKMLDVRKAYMESDPTWKDSLDRIEMYRRVLATGNVNLTLPLSISCYDTPFVIYGTEVELPEPGAVYAISASAGPNGAISPSGTINVREGRSQTFRFDPAPGYVVESVVVDGTAVVPAPATYEFKDVRAAHTIRATFMVDPVQRYTIAASAGAGGTISPAGNVRVERGADQAFAVEPAAGYRIADVLADGASVGAVASYVFRAVAADHSIEARFERIPGPDRKVRVTVTGNGSVVPAPDAQGYVTAPDGSDLTLSFRPGAGQKVDSLRVDGAAVPAATSYTFRALAADHTVAVAFASADPAYPAWEASKVYNGGNRVSHYGRAYEAKWWTQGDDPRNSGQWGVWKDLGPIGPVTRYTITASAGPNGSISDPGASQVDEGANKTYAITPASGYRVADVLVNGASAGRVATYTFSNVRADATISATFEVQPVVYHEITASAGPNGSISDAGVSRVLEGTDKTYTFAPAAGYRVASVTVDGSPAAVGASYTFRNVTGAHAISVSFAVDDVPAWAPNVDYKLNDKVSYGGSTWVCKYAHRSNSAWYPGLSGLWFWEKI